MKTSHKKIKIKCGEKIIDHMKYVGGLEETAGFYFGWLGTDIDRFKSN